MAMELTLVTNDDQEFFLKEGEDGIEHVALEMKMDPQFIILGVVYEDGAKLNKFIARDSIQAISLFDDDPDSQDEADELASDPSSNVTKLH